MSLINVAMGGETKYTPEGLPYNVGGHAGFMDELDLDKRVIIMRDDDDMQVVATEYWEGEHHRARSVHVTIKRMSESVGAEQGEMD